MDALGSGSPNSALFVGVSTEAPFRPGPPSSGRAANLRPPCEPVGASPRQDGAEAIRTPQLLYSRNDS